jgi:multiple sugar transport system substrate-binding protein
MHRGRGFFVGTVAVLALLLAGVAACGGGSGGGGGTQLRVLIAVDPQYPEPQRAWLDRVKQRFKAKTGGDLTFETFASAGEEQTKIQTSIVSGDGPDVYHLGTTFTPVAFATKGFQVLTDADWQKIGGRDRFVPESLGMSGPDPAHQIGVPVSTRPYGMVYNTAMFRAAGITAPPVTWDEFAADAKRLTQPAAGVYGTALDFADAYDPWKFLWMFTLQGGGRLVSDDLRQARLDSPEVAAAVGAYFDLLTRDQVVDPKSVGWRSAQALAAFVNGKAAMLPMVTPNAVPALDGSAVKGQYAFAPMPLVPPGAASRPPGGLAAGTIVSGDNIAIASYSRQKDLALSYLELITSVDEQLDYSQTLGVLPANAEAARKQAEVHPQLAPLVAAERTAVPTTFTGAWSDVQIGLTNVVTQSLPALTNGSYDPAAVRGLLAQANQKVQSSLNRQGR